MNYKITVIVSVKDKAAAEELKEQIRTAVEDYLEYEHEDLIACALEKEPK